MSESVLSMRNIHKHFGTKHVLRGVDFDVPRGSIVGLLGTNGCGKTTLIGCAMGLLKTDDGESTVFGEPSWSLSPAAKARIGYVPQQLVLYPWMRVGQVIAYHGSFYDQWDTDLTQSLVKRWSLPVGDKIATLSLGQLQRVGIVLAMGHRPELLVLDEPAAALDPDARRRFLEALIEVINEEGRTVLLSSHITTDIERVADRVAIMRDGRMLLHDDLGGLKDRIKRLTVTAERPLDGLPTDGVLNVAGNGRATTLTVDLAKVGSPEALAARWGGTVDVHDLNLEEIFLELHDTPTGD